MFTRLASVIRVQRSIGQSRVIQTVGCSDEIRVQSECALIQTLYRIILRTCRNFEEII